MCFACAGCLSVPLYVILQRGRATAMYGGFIRCAIALCPVLGGLLAADGARPARVFHVQSLLAMVAAASLLIFKKSTPIAPSSADHTAAAASTVWIGYVCVCTHRRPNAPCRLICQAVCKVCFHIIGNSETMHDWSLHTL